MNSIGILTFCPSIHQNLHIGPLNMNSSSIVLETPEDKESGAEGFVTLTAEPRVTSISVFVSI